MIIIKNKKCCSGCSGCANICPQKCIAMVEDEEGFGYPQVDRSRCVNCGLCEKVCPILNKKRAKFIEPTAYAAYNNDEQIRMSSSSGGIFTVLAEYVIGKNGVVFGAGFDENFKVRHIMIDNIESLEKLRSSKYSQSDIGNTFCEAKKILNNGRVVLFTGTPCQIGGLINFLGKDYENLITQDIICHGVPSPAILKKYISFRQNKENSKVVRINFREKIKGWEKYSFVFSFENGKNYVCTPAKKDPIMKMFLHNKCLRPSCYECMFKTKYRLSDITLADFWGIRFVAPSMNDNRGTSLVLVHSPKGKKLFEEIQNKITFKQVNVEKAIKWNKSMTTSAKPYKRDLFMKDFINEPFSKVVKKHGQGIY